MYERRLMFGLLIGLTLYVSIWRITLQESSMIEAENGYIAPYQFQQQPAYQRQHTVEPQISSVIYTRIGTTLKSNIQQQQQHQQQPNNNTNYHDNNVGNGSQSVYPKSYRKSNSDQINSINVKNNSSRLVASHNYISSSPSITVNNNRNNFNLNELPKNDLSNLIDLNDFRFTINQLPCHSNNIGSDSISNNKLYSTYNSVNNDDDDDLNVIDDNYHRRTTKRIYDDLEIIETQQNHNDNGPLVLILVHSAPNNYKKRLHIRETWGSLNTSLIRLIFLLGAVNDTKLQNKIELENQMYSDIVQGNFIDAYRNMTYKHVMALKWFTYYCPNAKFLLKIDDDVFVNTPYLIDYLNRYAKRSNLIFCEIVLNSRVKRSFRSKWRVSTKEYSNRYYPPYCPGYSILYSPDIVYRLYKEAQKTSYFWIDDVHITGTLAQKIHLNLTSSSSFILTKVLCEKILLNYNKNFKNFNLTNNHNNNNNHNMNNLNNLNNTNVLMNLGNFLFLYSWPDIKEQQAKILWKIIEKLR